MAKTTSNASSAKPSTVGLIFFGDGYLEVPDAKLAGIAPGDEFEVSPEIAERLLADATVPVEPITTGGTKA